jgi:hypothetical protein
VKGDAESENVGGMAEPKQLLAMTSLAKISGTRPMQLWLQLMKTEISTSYQCLNISLDDGASGMARRHDRRRAAPALSGNMKEPAGESEHEEKQKWRQQNAGSEWRRQAYHNRGAAEKRCVAATLLATLRRSRLAWQSRFPRCAGAGIAPRSWVRFLASPVSRQPLSYRGSVALSVAAPALVSGASSENSV